MIGKEHFRDHVSNSLEGGSDDGDQCNLYNEQLDIL